MLSNYTAVKYVKKYISGQRFISMNFRTKKFVFNLAVVMLGLSVALFVYYGHKKRSNQDTNELSLDAKSRQSAVFEDFVATGSLPPPMNPTKNKVILFWIQWYKTLTWKDR